jgi:hypothetical protein
LAHPRLAPLSSHRTEYSMRLIAKTYLGNAEKICRASTRGSPGTETSLVRSRADCTSPGPTSQLYHFYFSECKRCVLCVQLSASSSLHSGRKVLRSAQQRRGFVLAAGPCSTYGHSLLQITWYVFGHSCFGKTVAGNLVNQQHRFSVTLVIVLSHAAPRNVFGLR